MKKIALFAAIIAFNCTACAAMFQSTAQIVPPVGPMMIDVPSTNVTTTTVAPGGVVATAGYIEASNEENNMYANTEINGGMITSETHNGSLNGSATVSATGATATIVDSETGEVVSVSAGLPQIPESIGVVATVAPAVVSQTTSVEMVQVECGMKLEDHGALLEALRNAGQLQQEELIQSVARSNRLTVDQTVAIIKTLGFEPQREEAAVAIYPNVCDPGNWFKVYSSVGFVTADSIKERLGQQ